VEIVKAWTPIITAVLAMAGTIVLAILNSDDVGQSSVDSIEKQVENHLNSTVVPMVSEHVNKMKERIVRLETMNDIFRDEISRLRDRVNKLASRRRVDPEIPRSLAAPKSVRLKKKEKLDIPELDIKQQTLE
jgi:predicted RecB family endonuclease